MRVALYARVSTDEQARTGESILDQRQALERWAREHGHDVAGVYLDEGYSAHKSFKSRPQLSRLLEDVQAGKIDLIAFTKFDRWTRKASDYYKLQDILDAAKVPWTAILEDYETVTASGRFKVGIMLSVNQHEAERTSERIKFTFEQKRLRGEIISGNMPKGYKLENSKPVKDPETEEAISAFWRTYLSGSGLKASLLAADACGLHMAVSTGSFILRNARAYSGAIQGVSCDPYITPEQAEEVLRTRKRRNRTSGEVYLFSGLIYCSECGGAFGAHRSIHQRQKGEVVQIFYNCARKYRTLGTECQNIVNIDERKVEAVLLEKLEAAVAQKAQQCEAELTAQKARRANVEANKRIRAALEERKRRAWEAYLGGVIELSDYQKELERLTVELERLEPDLPPEDEDAPRKIRESLPPDWKSTYAELDRRHRRAFWAKFIEYMEITPEREVVFLLSDNILH